MSSKATNYFKMVNEEFAYGDFHKLAKGSGPKVMKHLQEALRRKQVPAGKALVFIVKMKDGAMLLVNPSSCCGHIQNNSYPQCVAYGNFKQKWVEMHHIEAPKTDLLHPEMALWTVDPRGQEGPSGIHFCSKTNKNGTLWMQDNTLSPEILAGDLRPDFPIAGKESWGRFCKGYKIKKVTVYTATHNVAYVPRTSSLRSIPSRPTSAPTTPRSSRPTTPRSDGTRSMSEDLVSYSPPVFVETPTYLESPAYMDMNGYPVVTQPTPVMEYTATPAFTAPAPIMADQMTMEQGWSAYYATGAASPTPDMMGQPQAMW